MQMRIVFLAAAVLIAGISEATVDYPFTATARVQSVPVRHGAGPATNKSSKGVAMPFRIGEKLEYTVTWAGVAGAASIELSVPERRDLAGWETWHFRALAHTLNLVRTMFTIDDQFDSYTDATTLESHQYETYLAEMGKRQDEILHFLPEGQTTRTSAAEIVVSKGTRDPLGAFYVLRTVDWHPTAEFTMPVYDGHDVYDLRARFVAADETVKVAAGNFITSKIAVRLFQRGKEVTGTNLTAWLAHDTARTPVLMLAQVPFADLRVELVSASQ